MDTELYRRIGIRIKSARENKGLSQEELANQLSYKSPASISQFESGQRRISIDDLNKIAEKVGLPLGYFLDSNAQDQEMQRFHLRASGQIWSSAQNDIAEFLSFAHNFEQDGSPAEIQEISDPKQAAENILKKYKISNPPVSPREIAETIGIPVIFWNFPDEVSGIFAIEDNKASIGINQYHSNVRQRFSIAHEIGHFVFQENRNFFMDFIDNEMSNFHPDYELEVKANKFAANLLMPEDWIREDYTKHGQAGLQFMAHKYVVSEQAMWFRLKNLNLVRS